MDGSLNPEAEKLFDVIVVGAGPCGLATAARLRESHPSALFTDAEQARYAWVSNHTNQTTIMRTKPARSKNTAERPPRAGHHLLSMLVLDTSGTQWLARWKQLFRTLNISHLRSPMFFHPDPSDRDSLLAYAHLEGRSDELLEIGGCVGKEVSKHRTKTRTKTQHKGARPPIEINERDRQDYYTPSRACFEDFCHVCQERYQLNSEHLLRQERVVDLNFTDDSQFGSSDKLFRVTTERHCYSARSVVLAVGAGAPIIPRPFPSELPSTASHIMQLGGRDILSGSLRAKIKAGIQTNVLVIGGGLTSAQVVDCILTEGVAKVWLLMRGRWKSKPFDVDLAWMSKFKNHQRAVFWTADSFEERLHLAKEARNGGSITPRFTKLLKAYERRGRLAVQTETRVKTAHLDPESGQWKIVSDPSHGELPTFDHVFFATGTHSDVNDIDFLQTMHRNFPIETVGGLPLLNDDLMWQNALPLFVTGKLATLRIGPGAGNLEGARLGAERMSWAINDIFGKFGKGAAGAQAQEAVFRDEKVEYALGIGNKFAQLER